MIDAIVSDIRNARIMLLNIKISINAAIDDPDSDAARLSEVYDKLDDAYDALLDTEEILND